MDKIIIPRNLESLVINGKVVDWSLPCLLFCPSTDNKSVLEQLVYRFLFRGAEDTNLRPYEVKKYEHPLAFVFSGQLAIDDVFKTPLDEPWNIARYFASEHAVIMPPNCSDSIQSYKSRFKEAYEMLKKWNPGSEVDGIGKKFERCIKPRGEIQLTRLRIPEVIALFNTFLEGKRYNKYTKGDYVVFLPYFDAIRRLMKDSMQDTEINSSIAIDTLKKEFYVDPNLTRVRVMDIFTLNHVRLDSTISEQEEIEYYKEVRQLYLDFIDQTRNKEEKISTYASIIAYDMLIQDKEEKKHFEKLKKDYRKHPKTVLIGKILDKVDEPDLWKGFSKLEMVGLDNHYHPDLLTIMLSKLNAYRSGHTCISPYPHHNMIDFLDYAQQTKLFSMKKTNIKGQTYFTLTFSQVPYISFQNQAVSEDGCKIRVQYVKENINKKSQPKDFVASCVDKYLLHPVFGIPMGADIDDKIDMR
jgi:hypothetical protein